jgi:hypothetical protein
MFLATSRGDGNKPWNIFLSSDREKGVESWTMGIVHFVSSG